jgi:hypothetical protein
MCKNFLEASLREREALFAIFFILLWNSDMMVRW